MKVSSNIHRNHRERLRQRYISGGIESFADHEVLELLLFYALPRVDTNELSHRLIEHFGSVRKVLQAPIEELSSVYGLNTASSTLLKLVGDLCVRSKTAEKSIKVLDNYDEVGKMLVNEFSVDSAERVVLILLDSKFRLIHETTISEGDFSSARINMRTIVHMAMLKNAAKIILAHNHPDGNPNPSLSDKAMTISVDNMLSQVGVELVEHYIIADEVYIGLRNASVISGEDRFAKH